MQKTASASAKYGTAKTAASGRSATGRSASDLSRREHEDVRGDSRLPRRSEVRDWISLPDLVIAAQDWLLDGEARLSAKTVEDRRFITDKLIWWLEREGYDTCGKQEIKRFMIYLRTGHESPGGRWGSAENPSLDPRAYRPIRPRSAGNYYRWLRTFFNFLLFDETLEDSPLRTLKPPIHRDDQIEPFSLDQQKALLRAAERSPYARRDAAIVLTLLDTGCRVSELCGMNWGDIQLRERGVRVRGKGDTFRTLPLLPKTLKAILNYIRFNRRADSDPLFQGERGKGAGNRFTESGVLQMVYRIGKAAGVEGVRCSPHTFRHTFAIGFLRKGGDLATLQTLLGHTSLDMTRRYLHIAQADAKRSHGKFSPVNDL